jgi:DNA-binding IclR family transcriptional regulator
LPRPSPQTERLVEIMEFLAADPRQQRSLAEIARMLQVEKATCFPMLAELLRVGWLVRHPQRKTYQLGPRLVSIGEAAKGAIDVVDMARPALAQLADELGQTCVAIITSGEHLALAEVVHPRGRRGGVMGQQVGDRIAIRPPLAGIFMAWADSETVDRWLSQDARVAADPTVEAHYRSALAAVRERRFGVEHHEPDPETLGQRLESSLPSLRGKQRAQILEAQYDTLTPHMMAGELEPDREYWPFSINAAAFDSHGRPVLAICVYDFREPLSSSEVSAIGLAVRDAARTVTAAMHGVEP